MWVPQRGRGDLGAALRSPQPWDGPAVLTLIAQAPR